MPVTYIPLHTTVGCQCQAPKWLSTSVSNSLRADQDLFLCSHIQASTVICSFNVS